LKQRLQQGEKACPVVFWKQLEVTEKETQEAEKIPMMRFYFVFNVAQCDGLKNLPATVETTPTEPDEIIAAMPQRPEIKHGMAKAFYSPGEDMVGSKRWNTSEELLKWLEAL
jgi:antirestriction protein ArdC